MQATHKPLPLPQLSELWSEPYRDYLVLVREVASNPFPCLVGKTRTRKILGRFIAFGASRFADDLQMLHVPLAPRADPEMELELDSFFQAERPFHGL